MHPAQDPLDVIRDGFSLECLFRNFCFAEKVMRTKLSRRLRTQFLTSGQNDLHFPKLFEFTFERWLRLLVS